MSTERPPFRADHVGSLLRPEPVKQARARLAAGEIDQAELTAVEDVEIRKMIQHQEAVGLQAVTDGECRRSFWHYDFLRELDGLKEVVGGGAIQFQGVSTPSKTIHVIGRIGYSGHSHVDHFRFVKDNTSRLAKMTIPSPSMLYYRGGRKMFDAGLYPDLDSYYADLASAYQKAVQAFYDAGCRYLQIDDTSFAYLCDPKQRQMLIDRGDDPDTLLANNIRVINESVKNRPSDMVMTMHICRGNFRSTFISSGGYEPVAEALFNDVDLDGYFMEWDNERSGGFEPLRFLPKGHKRVVVGLITSKTGELEQRDAILRRLEEAEQYAAKDQLCLSPQCGFASTEEGNVLTEDEQWAKLRLTVDIARAHWG